MLKILIYSGIASLFSVPSGPRSEAPVSDRYVSNFGSVVFSKDSRLMLFDFAGRVELCQVAPDRTYAMCDDNLIDLRVGETTVNFAGHDFIKEGKKH